MALPASCGCYSVDSSIGILLAGTFRGSTSAWAFSALAISSSVPQSPMALSVNASYVELPWQVGQFGIGTFRRHASHRQDMHTSRSGSPSSHSTGQNNCSCDITPFFLSEISDGVNL